MSRMGKHRGKIRCHRAGESTNGFKYVCKHRFKTMHGLTAHLRMRGPNHRLMPRSKWRPCGGPHGCGAASGQRCWPAKTHLSPIKPKRGKGQACNAQTKSGGRCKIRVSGGGHCHKHSNKGRAVHTSQRSRRGKKCCGARTKSGGKCKIRTNGGRCGKHS